jgi:hypothetical protein
MAHTTPFYTSRIGFLSVVIQRMLETAGSILFETLSTLPFKHNLTPRGVEYAYYIRSLLRDRLPQVQQNQQFNLAFPLA